MRVAALFGAAAIATASATVAVNIGVHPQPPVWDERAAITTHLALWIVLTALSLGMAQALPAPALPRRLATLPGVAGLIIPSFFVLAATALSGGMPTPAVATKLATGIATGVGLSFVLAFLNSFLPPSEHEAPADSGRPAYAGALFVTAVTALIWAGITFYPRTADNGQFRHYLRLEHEGRTLTVGVKRTMLTREQLGVLKISDRAGSNGLILEEGEWRSLMGLWVHAREAHTDTRAKIGTANDNVPGDPSSLSIEIMPAGAHLRISSTHAPTIDFQVDRAEFDVVTASLERTHRDLLQ